MNSRKNPLALIFALILVAACVPSSIMMVPEPTDDAELVGAGVLLVQVADTTPFGAAFPANQITLAPKDVNETDESQFPRLAAVDAEGDSTSFFYAVLPANEYSMSSIRSYHSFGEAYFSKFYPAGVDLGTFTIELGKVTDLGILAIFIKRSGDDYLFETVRTSTEPRTANVMSQRLPGLSGRLSNIDEPLGWHADGRDGERQNGYVSAVNRQIVFGEPYLDEASGAVSFPSRLGVVVTRSQDGDWRLDAFPDDCELRFLTTIGDDVVLVTEFDEIYRRPGSSDEWLEVDGPIAPGRLAFVGAYDSVGLFAVMQEADGVTIWTAADFASRWTQVHELRPELSFFESLDKSLFAVNQDITGADYIADGQYLYMALRKDLYRYDLTTNSVEELSSPNARSVQMRNGTITVVSTGTGTGSKVSFDAGQTWQRYTGKFYGERSEQTESARSGSRRTSTTYRAAKMIGHPIFLDTKRGIAIHEAKKDDSEPFLIETDDGGNSWFTATDTPLPEGCVRLVLANDEELLLGCFLTGEFYRSPDLGDTWEVDREVSET